MIIKFITIIKMDYQELSEKFLPIFYFHKDEKYFPVSIDEYLNETVLVNQNNETIEHNIMQRQPLKPITKCYCQPLVRDKSF